MKSLDDRIQECINIRKQLESMGLLTIHTIKEIITEHMNNYIKDGISETFKFTIPNDKTVFKIVLTSDDNKKSGVTIIK
jgi:hypothetical protein